MDNKELPTVVPLLHSQSLAQGLLVEGAKLGYDFTVTGEAAEAQQVKEGSWSRWLALLSQTPY